MIIFIFHARVVLRGNINTCVVYEQYCVPIMPYFFWYGEQPQPLHQSDAYGLHLFHLFNKNLAKIYTSIKQTKATQIRSQSTTKLVQR
jgi:hypothetical protein